MSTFEQFENEMHDLFNHYDLAFRDFVKWYGLPIKLDSSANDYEVNNKIIYDYLRTRIPRNVTWEQFFVPITIYHEIRDYLVHLHDSDFSEHTINNGLPLLDQNSKKQIRQLIQQRKQLMNDIENTMYDLKQSALSSFLRIHKNPVIRRKTRLLRPVTEPIKWAPPNKNISQHKGGIEYRRLLQTQRDKWADTQNLPEDDELNY